MLLRLTPAELGNIKAALVEKVVDETNRGERFTEGAPERAHCDRELERLRSLLWRIEALEERPAAALDTVNLCAVTAHEVEGARRVVMLMRPPAVMTPAEALRVAAWLIVGAELADTAAGNLLEVVAATVEAIHGA